MDLISYVANSLLGVLSTNLSFFEDSVPAVMDLYTVFTAVGWGLLIGNCIFQAMKSMLSGLGFEGESPAILLCRTVIFGFLLLASRQICDIILGLGASVIDLIGMPSDITLVIPEEDQFGDLAGSWVLVIIVGFVLGFQLIKLFLEIGERYVVVAVLTLLCPLGFALGGSKTTKDISIGYMRTLGSMVVMMMLNVLFLKLILSALSTVPPGALVLPWCVLVVGIARVARKVDNLISKIGLSPAITGDPLGHGGGRMAMLMAARTIMGAAKRNSGSGKKSGGSNMPAGTPPVSPSTYNGAQYAGAHTVNSHHTAGGSASRFSTSNTQYGAGVSSRQTSRSSAAASYGGHTSSVTADQAQSSRFGSAHYSGPAYSTGGTASMQSSSQSNVHFAGGTSVNTNRFGAAGGVKAPGGTPKGKAAPPTAKSGPKGAGPAARKTAYGVSVPKQGTAGRTAKPEAPATAQPLKQSRFGKEGSHIRQNQRPGTAAPTAGITGAKAVGRFGSSGNTPRSAGGFTPGQSAKPGAFKAAQPVSPPEPEQGEKQEETDG